MNSFRLEPLQAPVRRVAVCFAVLLLLAFELPAAGHSEVLLLSCMDYRLVDDVERYMARRDLRDAYDHVVLAGASLGARSEAHPSWRTTFLEHLDVAIELHHVRRVIVMDHRDCGAYRILLGKDLAPTPDMETAAHAEQLRAFRAELKEKYPKLEFELLLMDLSGKVAVID